MKDADIWDEISGSFVAGFEAAGMDRTAAQYCAEIAAGELHKKIAGERTYFPKKRLADRAALRREFNGRNVDEMASRFGVSRATVYAEIGRRSTRKKA